jgi:hypothetical protein
MELFGYLLIAWVVVSLAMMMLDREFKSLPYVGAIGGAIIGTLLLTWLGMGLRPAVVVSIITHYFILIPLVWMWKSGLRECFIEWVRGG